MIAGGGSSGWMAAALISRVLHDVDLTLVESKNVPVIGVGEATVPFINNFLGRVGFADFRSWVPQCDATLKTGIFFENWYEKGDRYWHPFEYLEYVDPRHHVGHCWLHWHRNDDPAFSSRLSFYNSFYCTTKLNAEYNKAPALSEFAYHLDSNLFAKFLKDNSPAVRHIQDEIVDVQLNDNGDIDFLRTATNGELKAELYIDCTGFRRLLIGKVAPSQAFHTYAGSLFCDRAVVLRFPYLDESDKQTRMHPYVKASAQAGGWIWTIPLFSRVSNGYVYASNFTSDEDAETELRRYCGSDRMPDAEILKVRFDPGKLDQLWVKNCVAIGLSGGFIEPLESTGLAITQIGIEMLVSMLDARYYDKSMIDRYNGHLDKFCTDIMHFIIAHYAFTSRDDTPFWRAVKHETKLPPELEARLEVFRKYLPTTSTKATSEVWMFRDISWFSVLLGMNFEFDTPSVDYPTLDRGRLIRDAKARTVAEMSDKLPNHYAYLRNQVYPANLPRSRNVDVHPGRW
jgi:tryptophan 6-halogenase